MRFKRDATRCHRPEAGAQHPTSTTDPIRPDELPRGRSSSFGSLEGSAIGPGHPFHPLHEQSLAAVHRLEAERGRAPDGNTARLALGATLLAAEHGFTRVDHVLLNQRNGNLAEGTHLFVVQGELNDPAQRRAHMQTDLALAAAPAETERRLAALQPAAATQDMAMDQPARRMV